MSLHRMYCWYRFRTLNISLIWLLMYVPSISNWIVYRGKQLFAKCWIKLDILIMVYTPIICWRLSMLISLIGICVVVLNTTGIHLRAFINAKGKHFPSDNTKRIPNNCVCSLLSLKLDQLISTSCWHHRSNCICSPCKMVLEISHLH